MPKIFLPYVLLALSVAITCLTDPERISAGEKGEDKISLEQPAQGSLAVKLAGGLGFTSSGLALVGDLADQRVFAIELEKQPNITYQKFPGIPDLDAALAKAAGAKSVGQRGSGYFLAQNPATGGIYALVIAVKTANRCLLYRLEPDATFVQVDLSKVSFAALNLPKNRTGGTTSCRFVSFGNNVRVDQGASSILKGKLKHGSDLQANLEIPYRELVVKVAGEPYHLHELPYSHKAEEKTTMEDSCIALWPIDALSSDKPKILCRSWGNFGVACRLVDGSKVLISDCGNIDIELLAKANPKLELASAPKIFQQDSAGNLSITDEGKKYVLGEARVRKSDGGISPPPPKESVVSVSLDGVVGEETAGYMVVRRADRARPSLEFIQRKNP